MLMDPAGDTDVENELTQWIPPCKKLRAEGMPYHLPPLIDEHVTVITDAKALLRKHNPELVQYIKLESLLPYLNKYSLLTDSEYDELLNMMIPERTRLLKLIRFMEGKGPEGFKGFLSALAEEPEHMGHKELTSTFNAYRIQLPKKPLETHSMRTITNNVALHAAMKPIQGSEFDLDEKSIQPIAENGGSELEAAQAQSYTLPLPAPSSKTEPSSGDKEFQEIKECLEHDHVDSACTSTQVVRKYPTLIFPSGPLKKKSHSVLYNSLFKMAWDGEEGKARAVMTCIRRCPDIAVDLKIVSMEVVHTVNTERDLKVLTSALAFTDRQECENVVILKCRLHRRIAGLHYRNNDLEDANEHMETALQLSHNIGPDIDTIYTMRLKALMLFEDYKKTKSRESYRDANKFFTRAMDHARQQPESKRVITERVKVSKALFHLDMREEYRQKENGCDTLAMEELEYRAQETLEDVDEEYLTDGDRAFFYLTRAKLFVITQKFDEAKAEAENALEINKRCGFDKRARDAEELLLQIQSKE